MHSRRLVAWWHLNSNYHCNTVLTKYSQNNWIQAYNNNELNLKRHNDNILKYIYNTEFQKQQQMTNNSLLCL